MQSIWRGTRGFGSGTTASVSTSSNRVVPLDDSLPLRRWRSPVWTRSAENRGNPVDVISGGCSVQILWPGVAVPFGNGVQ